MPVTWATYFFDAATNDRSSAGVHTTQVFLHALASLFCFLALRRGTGSTFTSAWVAGVFALHPLQVESVAWASERKGVVAGTFWMLSFWLHAGPPSRVRRFGVPLAVCAALGAKPISVTLPLVLLLWDAWPLGRMQDPAGRFAGAAVWRCVREKLPLLAAVVGLAVLTVMAQRDVGATASLDELSLGSRLANAPLAYVGYLGAFFWPRDLAVFYPHPVVLSAWAVGGALALLLAVTGFVVWQWRRAWWAMGWCWFLGALVPMLGIVQVGGQARADRYAYVTIVGLAIALGFGVRDRVRGPTLRAAAATLAVLTLVASAVETRRQLAYWVDGVTLFSRALEVVGPDALIHQHLGASLLQRGAVPAGRAHLEKAHELRPQVNVANNLAWSYATDPVDARVRPGRALLLARFAVQRQPEDPTVWDTFAAAQAAGGFFPRAIDSQRRALSLLPAHASEALRAGLAGRLALYERGERFRAPPAPDASGARNP
ncbi:MAG: hypothetical protein AAF430_16400 [Myxococcota bacterium]